MTIELGQYYTNAPDMTNQINTDYLDSFHNYIYSEYLHHTNNVNVWWTNNPVYYQTAQEQINDYRQNKCVHVFEGDILNSTIMDEVQHRRFRVVHECHHVLSGGDFSLAGEITVFKYALQSLKDFGKINGWEESKLRTIASILYSEIVLQAAAYLTTREWTQQKVVLCDVSGFLQ